MVLMVKTVCNELLKFRFAVFVYLCYVHKHIALKFMLEFSW